MARDFPPTGGPRPISSALQRVRASIPPPLPTTSATTGSPARAPAAASSTGAQPSATGAAVPIGGWVAERLGPFNLPADTMRSMSSALVSHLLVTTEAERGADGQFERIRLGPFQMKPGMDLRSAEKDFVRLREVLRPASQDAVAPLVARLKAMTKSAGAGPKEDAFAAAVIIEELARYPLDVVQWACEYWTTGGRESQWFPSWPELKELCERRISPRRRLLNALQWVLDGELDTPDWQRPRPVGASG